MYSPMGHDVLVLRSYDTIVAYYDLIYKEMVVCENAYNLSPTTTRHISCFKDFISNLEGDYTLYDAEPHEVGCWVYGW